MAVFYNDKGERCCYKTKEFELGANGMGGAFIRRCISRGKLLTLSPLSYCGFILCLYFLETGGETMDTDGRMLKTADAAQEEALSEISKYEASGSRESYLSAFACTFSGASSSAPQMSLHLALGVYGLQRFVNVTRQLNHNLSNKNKRLKQGSAPVLVDVKDACRELLVDLGLIPSDSSTLVSSRDTGGLNEGDDYDCG
jgi:hypothetical protein